MTLPWIAITAVRRLVRDRRRPRMALGDGAERPRDGHLRRDVLLPGPRRSRRTQADEDQEGRADAGQLVLGPRPIPVLVDPAGRRTRAAGLADLERRGRRRRRARQHRPLDHLRRADAGVHRARRAHPAGQPAVPEGRRSRGREVPLRQRGRPELDLLRQLRRRTRRRVDAARVLRDGVRSHSSTAKASRSSPPRWPASWPPRSPSSTWSHARWVATCPTSSPAARRRC